MSKIKIITDSNSGILQEEGKNLDIFVIPMPFTINSEEYLEEISISQEKFYEFLNNDANVTTSQPSQFYLQEIWNELLKEYDELVYIPMSSGLSGTFSSSNAFSKYSLISAPLFPCLHNSKAVKTLSFCVTDILVLSTTKTFPLNWLDNALDEEKVPLKTLDIGI